MDDHGIYLRVAASFAISVGVVALAIAVLAFLDGSL